MEMLHKIKALHREGVKLHLHVYEYGRGRPKELEAFCSDIHYYERLDPTGSLFSSLPHIIRSRSSPELLERLKADNHPILFEGLHTTWPLTQGDWTGRKVIIRLHNIEHEYYTGLRHHVRSPFQKAWFAFESRKLKAYEQEVLSAFPVATLTAREARYCREVLGAKQVMELPAFIGWNIPLCHEGVGTFCLFHGNLSVPENERAAIWLLKKVFRKMDVPFVIAGKSPSARLVRLAHRWQHTCIVADPSETEMQDLIRKAQVQVLPAHTMTGVKFKLLNGVFCGRHIVTNEAMVQGTRLDSACHITESNTGFQSIIMQLYRRPFTEEETELRSGLLQHYYDNRAHARQLISWLY